MRVYITFVSVAVLIVIAVVLKLLVESKRFTGYLGEQGVRSQLSLLDLSKYLVLNDLMIPNGAGTGTSQIDHVVCGPIEIVVIEKKNWDGRIYGQGSDRRWTVTFGRKKYGKENPVWQNKGHIAASRRIVRNSIPMYHFVLFNSRADLRITSLDDAAVMNPRHLVENIGSIREQLLTDVQVHAIHHQLEVANITDPDARKQHVENIRRKYHSILRAGRR